MILYDVDSIFLLQQLMLDEDISWSSFTIAKLNCGRSDWEFTAFASSFIEAGFEQSSQLGHFLLPEKASSFTKTFYLGALKSIILKLNCPSLTEIDISKQKMTAWCNDKELRKRVAQIEKLRHPSCQRIGIIVTNPLPDLDGYLSRSKQLARQMGKKSYVISMVQTMDEYKLGNFPEVEAFVILNSCFCSTVLESLDTHLPLLNWIEYEIACGVQHSYGCVDWKYDTPKQVEASDEQRQLIEADILKKDTWFGLVVDAGKQEPSKIKEGQSGIASQYTHEGSL